MGRIRFFFKRDEKVVKDKKRNFINLLDECRRDVYLKAKEYGLNLQQVVLDKDCFELKKSLLQFIIEKGDEKAIKKLYKSLSYKFFVGI